MSIKSRPLKHPIALTIGIGLFKGNPMALVFESNEDTSRPIGVSSATVSLDGSVYKINVSQSMFTDWIPADIKVDKLFKTPQGLLVALVDSMNVELSSVIQDNFASGISTTTSAEITLWSIPKLFFESTIQDNFVTYKEFGEALTTVLISDVVPTAQGTILEAVQISEKPTGNVGITLTPKP
jgi:hypothetical protein